MWLTDKQTEPPLEMLSHHTTTNYWSLLLPLICTARSSWLRRRTSWRPTGSLWSECWYRSRELDVCLVVTGFVLLVLIDIHLPNHSGVIYWQFLPKFILLPLLSLLSSVVLPDQLSPLLLNFRGWKEQLLHSKENTDKLCSGGSLNSLDLVVLVSLEVRSVGEDIPLYGHVSSDHWQQ